MPGGYDPGILFIHPVQRDILMTAYRSLLRFVLLLSMVGGLVVFIPRAQAEVTRQAPAGSVSLTVVASSRKGLGGRYVRYAALSFPSSLTFGPQGRLYFINADRTILTLSRRGVISVVARAGLRGYALGPGNRQVPEYNELDGLAITRQGTIDTLFNSAFSRVTPHGHIVFVPLHTPGNRALLNPNAFSTPYEARFHYPPFQYLATGPRGQVYVSMGVKNWRLGPGNRLIVVHNPCHAPAPIQNSVTGPHNVLYVAEGAYIQFAPLVCPVTKTTWTILFHDPKRHFQGTPAISPHGHYLYVTSRRTIYRLPLPPVSGIEAKRK